MDYESIFEGLTTLRVQFCELSVEDGRVVVTAILDDQMVPKDQLPSPAVARTRIGPGEAVLVEDVLYAWIPPVVPTAKRAPDELASDPSELSQSPRGHMGESEVRHCSGSSDAPLGTPASEVPWGQTETPQDPVDATERLTRLSFEMLKKNEELVERHMRRIAYLDKRQGELDRRAEAIANAQAEQLKVLTEVTSGFAAGVRQLTKPEAVELPDGYRRACDELSAASAQSIPFGLVAQQIGAFLRGAGADWFFPDLNGPTE
ncbi:MAG: hypothetical protein KC468_18595 [Myxococcales bacterium]|nr:hypothetical protein [Myxococcales bacterium]